MWGVAVLIAADAAAITLFQSLFSQGESTKTPMIRPFLSASGVGLRPKLEKSKLLKVSAYAPCPVQGRFKAVVF
jgi:hypothetical protein